MGRDVFSAENDGLRKSRNIQPLTKLQKSPHMVPGYSGDRVDWCHKLNVYVPPPQKNLYVESLTPSGIVFKGGSFVK